MAIELFKLVGSIMVNSDEANKSISKTEKPRWRSVWHEARSCMTSGRTSPKRISAERPRRSSRSEICLDKRAAL